MGGDKVKREKPISKKIVDNVKKNTNLWVPYEPEENPLNGKTADELYGLVGAKVESSPTTGKTNTLLKALNTTNSTNTTTSTTIPKTFDSRTKWPSCIHPVMH